MRLQIANSVYGLLDYAAYPFGMLALAPIVLRHLGSAQYGIWAVATAIVSFASIMASGFGDANIQQLATRRRAVDSEPLLRVVRATMGIHILLGTALGLILWIAAPTLASRLSLSDVALHHACLSCIRIAAIITLVRAIETVCISTQRAFERYGAAVRISIAGRLLSLVAAAVLATFTGSVVNIMAATAVFASLGLIAQLFRLRQLLDYQGLAPSFEPAVTRELIRFGIFTWLLSATGVMFSQADRLFAGASMGASAVVSYALCAQISQPVYGLTAAGLHFLFPHFASRLSSTPSAALRKTLLTTVLINVLLVIAGTGSLLAFSGTLLHVLAPDAIARECAPLLPSVLASSALLAFCVSGTYAMLALGRVLSVTMINLAATIALLLVIVIFLRGFGVTAIVAARLIFALISLLVYVPLFHELRYGVFRSESPVARTHEIAAEEA
ncbi:oligosaccharide flippase family protein [Telmatobacter sp. DSM 110680]|uniref:Oligosaccharide flippase family protein n=1 Tax=Telmatobacter sp. DSM 110680 TaxID=3036704 RepID=A0AAU7DNB8_9BACT